MAATEEQTAGIQQINDAINQMEQVTQQNAALVEEAAAASGSMQNQAAQLAHVVSVFRLDSTHAGATAIAADTANRVVHAAPLSKRQTSLPLSKPQKPARKQLPAADANGEWEEF
jgi:uncharacterized phage infection (PIP) family protein YhgE